MSDSTDSEPWPLPLPVLEEDPRGLEGRTSIALFRLHHRLERRVAEILNSHNLTMAQFDILATLSFGENITQQELAERLLVTKGNVVGLLDRISAAGLVERRPDPEDRRVNRLFLTEAGRRRLAEAKPTQQSEGRKFFSSLTQDELRILCQFLERLEAANQG